MNDERELIERCLKGNRKCFEVLIKRYQHNVIALSINILGNYEDALDMMQETFMQVYIHLKNYDMERSFKTWLLSIAAKRCLDYLRKRKSILNYFLKQSQDFQENINRCYETKTYKFIEESEIFSPLLKKLSPNERVALRFNINENYSAKEIATVLNCSENTVRVHLFNAKQKLKKHICFRRIKNRFTIRIKTDNLGGLNDKTEICRNY